MEQTQQQQQQQQQRFQCTGDCLNCRAINDRRQQWQYCAAQFTYNTMRMVQSMRASVEAMAGTIEELKAKVEAIQDSEATVFDPNAGEKVIMEDASVASAPETNTETAQEGDGAA